ncbi:hypothetical protein Scep_015420 [Stephania cephalantha]|uniref:BHLH domain-containing protein n=1 Tax=Stephania cephalantha TaxID=152367 RepID=A0AAP0J361_9MAGN
MQTAFQPSQQDLMEFGFHDFVNDSNFDQFAELLRGENADRMENYYPNCDSEIIFSSGWIGNHGDAAVPGDMFELNGISTNSDPNSIVDSFRPFCEDIGVDEIDNGDDEYSSETAMPTPAKAKGNDRSKTLISERRRRGSMKEKLYALRSLVPNITKMDKASIIGDAVLYVQQLQAQAKNLKAEIAGLESSLKRGAARFQAGGENPKKLHVLDNNYPICRKIEQMDVFQVGEGEFYVRLVCNKGGGVAVSLHRALESLTPFDIQNSNLTTTNDKFGLTFTISVSSTTTAFFICEMLTLLDSTVTYHNSSLTLWSYNKQVRECGEQMSLTSLKLWVTGALLKQGFEFKAL